MPVSGHPIPGPERDRSDTMGHAVEAGPERLRRHLRRPEADEGQLIMNRYLNRDRTDPNAAGTIR